MTFLRLLNVQGIAGLAASLALAVLLMIAKGEVRHWKQDSARFEQLYTSEQAALAGTVANTRAAAEAARAADEANAKRAAAEQRAISERSQYAFQSRLADARARAERLRVQTAAAPADPRGRAGAPVPGLSAPSSGPAQASGQDRLPASDALTATEQAIQLDELINWVRRQHAVAVSADESVESRPASR